MNDFEPQPGSMVFTTVCSPGARLFFMAAGFVPLLAPYELLFRPGWGDMSGPVLASCLAISLGALSISVLMFLVAVFGINRRVEFDTGNMTVRIRESHLILRQCRTYPFADIATLAVVCHDWSDGPSTYELSMTPGSDKPFGFGNFSSRAEAEAALTSLRKIIAGR